MNLKALKWGTGLAVLAFAGLVLAIDSLWKIVPLVIALLCAVGYGMVIQEESRG